MADRTTAIVHDTIDSSISGAIRRRGRARLLQGTGYALLAAGVIVFMETSNAPRYLLAIPLFFLATSSLSGLRGAILFFAPELELHRLTPGAHYLNLVIAFGLGGAAVGVIALVILTQALGIGRSDPTELAASIALVFGGFAAGSVVGVRAVRRRIAATR
jgi:hypothetical protein